MSEKKTKRSEGRKKKKKKSWYLAIRGVFWGGFT